jgi:hypothetical protein
MGNPTNLYGEQQLHVESVSSVTATNSVDLGTRRYWQGADYVYVYNGSSNEQLTTGRGAKLASGSTGYTADVAVAAAATFSAAALMGVCVHATFTTGTYGWLMTRGFAQVENFGATSIGAGESLQLHTSGTFTRSTAPTAIAIYSPRFVGIATAAQATTTTGSFTAYINSTLF